MWAQRQYKTQYLPVQCFGVHVVRRQRAVCWDTEGNVIVWDLVRNVEERRIHANDERIWWLAADSSSLQGGDDPTFLTIPERFDGRRSMDRRETAPRRSIDGGLIESEDEEDVGQCICVTASNDKTLAVLDVFAPRGKELLRRLVGHEHPVWCADVNLQADLVASGSDNDEMIIWRLSTGQLLHTVRSAWLCGWYDIRILPSWTSFDQANPDGERGGGMTLIDASGTANSSSDEDEELEDDGGTPTSGKESGSAESESDSSEYESGENGSESDSSNNGSRHRHHSRPRHTASSQRQRNGKSKHRHHHHRKPVVLTMPRNLHQPIVRSGSSSSSSSAQRRENIQKRANSTPLPATGGIPIVLAAARQGVLQVDPNTGNVMRVYDRARGPLPNFLTVTPDASTGLLYTSDTTRRLCVWSLTSGQLVNDLTLPGIAECVLIHDDKLYTGIDENGLAFYIMVWSISERPAVPQYLYTIDILSLLKQNGQELNTKKGQQRLYSVEIYNNAILCCTHAEKLVLVYTTPALPPCATKNTEVALDWLNTRTRSLSASDTVFGVTAAATPIAVTSSTSRSAAVSRGSSSGCSVQ